MMLTATFSVGADAEPMAIKAITYDSEGNKSEIITKNYTFGTLESFDVHFKNTSNWNNVYIYLFDKNTNTAFPNWAWPGVEMSKEGTSPWYKYNIAESVEVGIVFHNNAGQQTDDLARTTNGWYDYSTNTWHNECPGDCPGEIPLPVLDVDPVGGNYNNLVTATLSTTNEGEIYNTTNGDAPDERSTPYTEDLTFTATTNLKAIAYNTTGSSNIIDETYTITTTEAYDVHFKNTSNWNDVYIYLFNKVTGEQLAEWAWPGHAMTQEQTSNWHLYTIDEDVEVGIVFNNNNNGQQIGDLFRTTNGWYDNDRVSQPSNLKSSKTTTNQSLIIDETLLFPYPNPFKDKVELVINEKDTEVKVRITDLKGTTIYSNEIHTVNGRISLNPEIKKGAYILNLTTNKTVYTYRIIKE